MNLRCEYAEEEHTGSDHLTEEKSMEGMLTKRSIFELIARHDITSEEGLRLLRELQGNTPTASSPVNPRPSVTMYYRSVWKKAEPQKSEQERRPFCPLLIFDKNEEVRNALRGLLKDREAENIRIVLVKPGKQFKDLGDGTYEANPGQKDDYWQLLETLKEQHSFPYNIIHLWSEEECDATDEAVDAHLTMGVKSVFYLSQALMAQQPERDILLLYFYRGIEEKGAQLSPPCESSLNARSFSAAASGFAKTIRLENPKFIYKTIEIQQASMTVCEMVKTVTQELQSIPDEDVEIRYKGNLRFVKRLEEYDPELEEYDPKKDKAPHGNRAGREEVLREGGVYLITGGAGGLGFIFAEYLAKQVKARLILTGRSELCSEKEAKLQELRSTGAMVMYLRSDVSKEEDVKGLINRIKDQYQRIDGIIHASGVLRDSFLMKKTEEEWEAVLAPKVYATVYLDRATRDEPLDFFVLFSSIAGVIGNAGQSDYAYANSFLDNFASLREALRADNKRKGKTISIDWPLWKEGGMQVGEEDRALMFEQRGLVPLPTQEGIESWRCISQGVLTQSIVIHGERDRVRKFLKESFSNGKTIKSSGRRADYDSIDTSSLFKKTEGFLKELFRELLKLPPEKIESDVKFEEYGIDSILIKNFNFKMEKAIGPLSKTLLFEHQTLRELTDYLVTHHRSHFIHLFRLRDARPSSLKEGALEQGWGELEPLKIKRKRRRDSGYGSAQNRSDRADEIAIIGLSGRYPKAADIEEFWENLKSGNDCITEIPKDRWDWRSYYDPDVRKAKQGKIYCKWGGFLSQADAFDPLFFNISPVEAKMMDPQERIFLETAWATLEDAGYTREGLIEHAGNDRRGDVGVFVGVTTNTYHLLRPQEWQKGNFVLPNSLPWSIANRVSYIFNFHGPSMPVDTACSSSLIALHLACESLKRGECRVALAGGVNLYLHMSKYLELCSMRMLSQVGRCCSFGDGADGFVPGEGVGAVLLKPLDTAIKQRDHIYAVIKGSWVNHGGRTNGYTVPNPNAQAELIVKALENAEVHPRTISFIEAHATGTSLGDPVEIAGITKAFRTKTSDKHFCSIGCVKSNIGHLESAAGIAGLTKIVLQLKHKQLVPSLHSTPLNLNINFEDSPFYVQQKLTKWEPPVLIEHGEEKRYPRRAGMSSFGAGGANAHVVVEEYEDPNAEEIDLEKETPRIVVLSARSEERLKSYAGSMVSFLDKNDPSLSGDQKGKEELFWKIKKDVLSSVSELLNVDEKDIDIEADMSEYGFNAFLFSQLVDRMNEKYAMNTAFAPFAELSSLASYVQYLYEEYKGDFLHSCQNRQKDVSPPQASALRSSPVRFSDIAYTLQVGRQPMNERLAVIVSNNHELKESLTCFCRHRKSRKTLYRGNAKKDREKAKLLKAKLLLKGSSEKERMKAFMKGQKLEQLARLWVWGTDIDWGLLYPEQSPRRISLPTYPFERERYWVPESDEPPGRGSAGKGQISTLHPLVDRVVPRLENKGLLFQKRLYKTEPIVSDHNLRGESILAGMVYLEMAFGAVSQVREAQSLTLSKAVWLHPLSFVEDTKEVQIFIKERSERLFYEIRTQEDAQSIIHAKGEFSYDVDRPQETAQPISIHEIKERCPNQMNGERVYTLFKEEGIEYGPYYQGIEQVWMSEREALSRVSLAPEYESELSHYTLHPRLLDSALQTAATLALTVSSEKSKKTMLPFGVEEVEVLQPLKARGYAYVKAAGENRYDIAILDDDGFLSIRLFDVSFREQKDPLRQFFFLPKWRSSILVANQAEQAGERQKREPMIVLIVYPPRCFGLEKALSAVCSGEEVIEIILGSQAAQHSERCWEIDIDDPFSFQYPVERIKLTPRERSRLCVYFLGGVQTQDRALEDMESFEQNQKRGVYSLFRLIKALDIHGFTRLPIELKVITNDIHQVLPDEIPKPWSAGLLGLSRVIAREFPHLKTCCIDISLEVGDLPEDQVQARVGSILAVPCLDQGHEVAVRDGSQYVRTLEPVVLPPVVRMPFKQKGVYFIVGGAGEIGLAVSEYLAERAEARLVLVGRSELNARKKERISQIESKGGRVFYLQADVTDPESMADAVEKAKSHFGEVNGVIHSALVFHAESLANLDEETFRAVLDPKVRGSFVLYTLFHKNPLDFMIFFSSSQSFIGDKNQSSYAAGCSFEDAFALSLNKRAAYPVMVINWGYWAAGAQAQAGIKERLAILGFQTIEPDEGLVVLSRVIASQRKQVVALKADDDLLGQIGVETHRRLELLPEKVPSLLERAIRNRKVLPADFSPGKLAIGEALKTIERMGLCLLLKFFHKRGVFHRARERYGREKLKELLKIIPCYSDLYEAHLNILKGAGFVQLSGGDVVTTQAIEKKEVHNELDNLEDEKKRLIRAFPDIEPHVNLLWICLSRYPDILTGSVPATDVMFPHSSMELAEGVYRGNSLADSLNQLVSRSLLAYREARLPLLGKDEKIKIIEVGAGIGGTSASVLETIKDYGEQLWYVYTDVSRAFVLYGEKEYGARYPFMEFDLLDIEREVESQGYRRGSFDIVIASNVLHATRRIDNTLRNVKTLLGTNGWLILNEAVAVQNFTTLTFGLLDGWWRFEDRENRLERSPLLSTALWEKILKEEGFEQLAVLCRNPKESPEVSHNVFVAQSNGELRVGSQERAIERGGPGKNRTEALKRRQAFGSRRDRESKETHGGAPIPNRMIQEDASCTQPIRNDDGEKQFIQKKIADSVVDVLQIERREIDPDAPYSDFGVDSILAIEIIHRINEAMETRLRTTDLFNYSTIRDLAEHIAEIGYVIERRDRIEDSAIAPSSAGGEQPKSEAKVSGSCFSSKQQEPSGLVRSRGIEGIFHRAEKKSSHSERKSNHSGPDAPLHYKREDVAVIGMSCQFPGARDVHEFWRNLAAGKSAITEIPKERFGADPWYEKVHTNFVSRWGGFLTEADRFDPLFFNISPLEAESMDPQQRLFLQEAWKALEDAGYSNRDLDKERCDVFVGCSEGDYKARVEPESNSFYIVGNNSSILAARISYYLNLKGPSIAIDTACSSSLVAVHLACESLRSGTSRLAIAGGVAVITTLTEFVGLGEIGMLSPGGRCRVFDNGADGFVIGEGVGVVVLKPLHTALRDKDHIYGIIKGSSINQDGKTNGITAPSAPSQTALECEVYGRYNIHPETIGYVEAHGTGTKLGDPIEIHALIDAFRKYTQKKRYCPIGSVKSNIGHTTSASGIAGLIKVLCCLKHRKLVPSINFTRENEHINFQDSPFYVNTSLKDWSSEADEPRRAVISSFGMSGTNCHMVMEEAPEERMIQGDVRQRPFYLIAVSAKTEKALQSRVEDLAHWLEEEGANHSLRDIASTLLVGRSHFSARSALVVRDMDDLKHKINAICENGSSQDYLKNSLREAQPKREPALLELGRRILNELQEVNTLSESEHRDKLLALGDLYTKGYDMDWHTLFRDEKWCRISLPTYPFASERYWISDSSKRTKQHVRPQALPEASDSIESSLQKTLYFQDSWESSEAADRIDASGINLRISERSGPEDFLVFDTREEVREALRDRLQGEGVNARVILVKPGESFNDLGDHTYELNPNSQEHYHHLLSSLKSRNHLPTHLVHLWAARFEKAEFRSLQDRADISRSRGVYSVFYLMKAYAQIKNPQIKSRSPERFIFFYKEEEDASEPLLEAVAAYSRSLNLIFPHLLFSTVQIVESNMEGQGLTDILMHELWVRQKEKVDEIRYRDGMRYVKKPKPLEMREGSGIQISYGGVYLLSGGAGGLGLIFARYLAEKYRATVVLIGRSTLTEEKQRRIQELGMSGSEVLYLQADVASAADMQRIVAGIKQRFGRLDGVIHAAGVESKNLVIEKDLSEFEATLRPKVEGTVTLDEVTKGEELDFFVMFSSASSVIGDFGQCDYAIGNRFMDNFARLRECLREKKQRQGRAIAINWPLWREGGMHFDREGESLYLKTSGLTYLETERGLRAFEEILSAAPAQVMVITGDPQRVHQTLGVAARGSVEEFSKDTSCKERSCDEISPLALRGSSAISMKHRIEKEIQRIVSKLLKIDLERVEPAENLGNFGFDSITLKTFAKTLGDTYRIEVSPTLFFARSTIKSLGEYLVQEFGEEMRTYYTENERLRMDEKSRGSGDESLLQSPDRSRGPERREAYIGEDIAIIGASGRFPGSRNLEEYWRNIFSEKDLITDIPPDRWDWRSYYGDPATGKDKTMSKWGGFLTEIDRFDADFFSISPREAAMMDPQHRLLLETVWHTIEDAGYRASEFSGRSVGVFIGVESNDYQQLLQSSGELNAQTSTGNHHAMTANRVSFLLNLRGPSESINTACSSSSVAVHRAVKSIQSGECELAIAGGVSVLLSPHNVIGADQIGILSPDGRCKTFDKHANGYVKGEGVGTLLLKSLSKAVEDHDHIYAVIKGTGVNHCGRSNSLTAPNSEAQAALLKRIYEQAGVDVESVTYIEAHGTGTELGDPVEIEGLKKVFGELIESKERKAHRKHYCGLGTVKTNIGHLEAASGIAGIMKVLLAMRHKKLPGLLHFREINPYIDLRDSPFYVVDKTREWERIRDEDGNPLPRRAGVSSFGFGGANAHIILEEYAALKNGSGPQKQPPRIVILSARNEERLKEYAGRMVEFLERRALASNRGLRRDEGMEKRIQDEIVKAASDILEVDEDTIDTREQMSEYGFDGIKLAVFADWIEERYGCGEGPRIFLEQTTLEKAARYVYERMGGESEEERGGMGYGIGEIAYTLQVGREEMEERLGVVVRSEGELREKLRGYCEGRGGGEGIYRGRSRKGKGGGRDGGVERVKELAEAGRYEEIVELWVSGEEIEWRKLYSEEVPGRISLPTYPFARDRYWFDMYQKRRKDQGKETRKVIMQNKDELGERATTSGYHIEAGHPPQKKVILKMTNSSHMGENAEGSVFPEQDEREKQGDAILEPEIPQLGPETPTALEQTSSIEKERLRSQVKQRLADVLYMESSQIDERRTFLDLGLDSILGVEFIKTLNKELQISIKTTKLYDYPTIDELAGYLSTIIGCSQEGGAEKSLHVGGAILNRNEESKSEESKYEESKSDETSSGNLSFPKVSSIGFGDQGFRDQGFGDQKKGASKYSHPESPKSEEQSSAESVSRQLIRDDGTIVCRGALVEGVGDIKDVRLKEVAIAPPKGREVRIAVRASALNFADTLCVKGLYPTLPDLPFVLGFQVSGIVERVGRGVTKVKEGDPVIALMDYTLGGHAEAVNTHEELVVKKPVGISFEDACAFPDVFVTAYYALYEIGRLKEGEHVLIQTAAGGVGLMAVQLAKLKNATVYGTSSSNEKLAYLRSRGVDFVINYATEDFSKKIKELTHGRGVDVVLNTLGGNAVQKGIDSLAYGGRYLELAVAGLRTSPQLNFSNMVNNQSFHSIDLRKLGMNSREDIGNYLTIMTEMIHDGAIQSIVSKSFPAECINEALEYIEKRRSIGKVVLSFSKEDLRILNRKEDTAFVNDRAVQSPDIAIIGVSGRFPGAKNIDEFWQNLANGVDSITEVPPMRWDIHRYYDPDLKAAGKTYCKWGGFLDDIDTFDPLFFNISPAEAEVMDPQQRLLLEESWRLFENAGYSSESVAGRKCGVFFGIYSGDYGYNFISSAPNLHGQALMGTSGSILAARISYFMNLFGPNMAIDTACSSALVGVALACQSIANGESEMAVAGGVTITTKPNLHIMMSKTGMLSKKGKCRTFDNDADGFVPGEAVGVVLLKPLAKAIEDRDTVWGVIRGWGINYDGKTNGITAPSAKSQKQLEIDVYERFRINPEEIGYVEAHGTGTKLGDPIEADALTEAFSRYTDRKRFCAIGSVKTNIGHALAAAGISGLIKLLLCLKHQKLVPSLNFREENEHINFHGSPFYVNTGLKDWQREGNRARKGAVSSFGFSGTNCHIVVEEGPARGTHKREGVTRPWYFIPVSAKTAEALNARIKDLSDWITERGQEHSLGDVAYTLLVGRSHFPVRSALIVKDMKELSQSLKEICEQGTTERYMVNSPTEEVMKPEPAFLELGKRLLADLQKVKKSSKREYRDALSALADLYRKGYDLDWTLLYSQEQHRRIPLSTYPFAQERYWTEEAERTMTGVGRGDGTIHKLHPLIDRNTSNLKEQRFTTLLTGSEFYLIDHVVGDQKVFPAVTSIEMARAAGDIAGERKVRKIKNIVWPRFIAVDKASLDVHIMLSPGQDTVGYEVYSDDGADQRWVCAQGRLIYENHARKKERSDADSIDIEAIRGRCHGTKSRSECYDLLRAAGMNYGPSFQAIEELYHNEEEALSRVVLPQSLKRGLSDFVLHPTLMDAALQTILGLMDHTQGEVAKPYLPFALDEVEIVNPLPEICYAYATPAAHNRDAGSSLKKYTIQLVDAEGRVLVRMKDVALKALESQHMDVHNVDDEEILNLLRKLAVGKLKADDVEQLIGVENE